MINPEHKLPSGWRQVKLPQVAELNPRSFSVPIKDNTEVSFVPMKAVEEETGRLFASETCPWSEVRKGYTPFQEGDVIFAKITPCMENGKYALARGLHGGRAAGSTEFHVLRPSSEIDPKFLLYFLFNPEVRRAARMNMRGAAGQLRVPSDFFEHLVLPVPPLREQRRVVSEIERRFTQLEAAVSSLRRAQSNLKRFRASLLHAAFHGQILGAELPPTKGAPAESGKKLLERILSMSSDRPVSKARTEKRQGLAEQLNRGLPDAPTDWTWATIDQLATVQLGRQRSPGNISKHHPTKYIRAANITENGLALDDVLEMEFDPRERERYALKNGDIVLSEASGSPSHVGKPAIWRNELPLCCFQNTVIRVRPRIVSPEFLYMAFQHFYVNGIFARISSGVGINHLSANKFSSLKVPLPPLREQKRIVAEVERRLSIVLKLEYAVSHNLQRATRLRQSILKQAFSGRI